MRLLNDMACVGWVVCRWYAHIYELPLMILPWEFTVWSNMHLACSVGINMWYWILRWSCSGSNYTLIDWQLWLQVSLSSLLDLVTVCQSKSFQQLTSNPGSSLRPLISLTFLPLESCSDRWLPNNIFCPSSTWTPSVDVYSLLCALYVFYSWCLCTQ